LICSYIILCSWFYKVIERNVYNVLVSFFIMIDCVFCKIVNGDLPSDKVFENEDFIVIKDVNPKVEGHLLVISKTHYESFLDLPEGLYSKFLKVVKEVVMELKMDNFNLVVNNGGVAGQLVPHVHLHILPRKEGDVFRIGV
jgi:histidine triad (HIT) family protein